jgi:NADPH2:quinone reductase
VALAPSTIDTGDFYPRNVHIHGFQLNDPIDHGYDPRPELREQLPDALATGRFTVPVDSTFGLPEAPAAHRHLESRRSLGKLILTP